MSSKRRVDKIHPLTEVLTYIFHQIKSDDVVDIIIEYLRNQVMNVVLSHSVGNPEFVTYVAQSRNFGGYESNNHVVYININNNEFNNFRISSGTYETVIPLAYKTIIPTETNGLQVTEDREKFYTHWTQTGSIFRLSGTIGMNIVATKDPEIDILRIGDVANPQLYIPLPVNTEKRFSVTINGIATAYLQISPKKASVGYIVTPSFRRGTTADSDGILLTIEAPQGLIDRFSLESIAKDYTPIVIVRFDLSLDIT